MNCCVKCFHDRELRAIIQSLNSIGTCDFCHSKNIPVYDIDQNTSLTDLIEGLLEVYTPISHMSCTYPREKSDLIKNILHTQWDVFSLSPDDIYRLITTLCPEKYAEQRELFDEPVGIIESVDQSYLSENSIIGTFEWDDFVSEIKHKNRFHTGLVNKDVLSIFLEIAVKPYKAGEIFYRARICSSDQGFHPQEMYAPPSGSATAGRANPEGISCLYLADSERTTLHEIRAGVYDYVTVGKFQLRKDIEIINLAALNRLSPFSGIDSTLHAINLPQLKKISDEIAKPLRRHDSTLDYLPTQYISDYIKSRGYDGIEYKSTMHAGGYNLAIFDESTCECIDVSVYDINRLEYSYKVVE